MIRNLSILALFCLSAMAQPNAFTRVDIYERGGTQGTLRLFELRANGSNFVGIRARSAMGSDCVYEFSAVGIIPCSANTQTLGDPSVPFSHAYAAAATISGSGTALTLSGSSSGSALDITGFGGGRAYSFFGRQRVLAGGDGFYVTPDGFTQNVVIDASRNATVANLTILGTCSGCPGGISTINGSSASSQTITSGSAGTDVNIASGGGTVTINIPSASGSARGVVTTGSQTFAGLKTFTWAVDIQDTLTASKSSSPAITIPNATAFNALNIQNGGGAALTWFATNSLNTTGTVAVGPSTISLQAVIDNAGNLFPYSNYGSDQGSSSKRYNTHWGRFLNLRTNGGNLAGITARDNSNNVTFSMGDGGGTGGEFSFLNGSLTEYFAAINGQVRFNGANGLSSNFTCPAGQAVKSMNIQNGGTITATCAVP